MDLLEIGPELAELMKRLACLNVGKVPLDIEENLLLKYRSLLCYTSLIREADIWTDVVIVWALLTIHAYKMSTLEEPLVRPQSWIMEQKPQRLKAMDIAIFFCGVHNEENLDVPEYREPAERADISECYYKMTKGKFQLNRRGIQVLGAMAKQRYIDARHARIYRRIEPLPLSDVDARPQRMLQNICYAYTLFHDTSYIVNRSVPMYIESNIKPWHMYATVAEQHQALEACSRFNHDKMNELFDHSKELPIDTFRKAETTSMFWAFVIMNTVCKCIMSFSGHDEHPPRIRSNCDHQEMRKTDVYLNFPKNHLEAYVSDDGEYIQSEEDYMEFVLMWVRTFKDTDYHAFYNAIFRPGDVSGTDPFYYLIRESNENPLL